jgi:hypothetical protein
MLASFDDRSATSLAWSIAMAEAYAKTACVPDSASGGQGARRD